MERYAIVRGERERFEMCDGSTPFFLASLGDAKGGRLAPKIAS